MVTGDYVWETTAMPNFIQIGSQGASWQMRTMCWSQTSKMFLGNPRWGSARRSLQADSSWQSL